MPIDLKEHFTLLIPTYNRTSLLKKLLQYLKAHSVHFPILVLDSSIPDVIEKNAALISRLNMNNIHHVAYPNDTQPFKKIADGFQRVSTPFSGMCADDDIIFIDALYDCVDFLLNNPDYGLAHGLYCAFWDLEKEITINRLIYERPSLDNALPEHRICQLMQHYEATTYAIHRTCFAKQAFKKAASLDSILFQELLSSVLCVLYAKTARIPKMYNARSNERITSYPLGHPVEWIVTSPQTFFEAHLQYRHCIFDSLKEIQGSDIHADLRNMIDIAHLCYLSPYMRPEILNFALNIDLRQERGQHFNEALWQKWAELNFQPSLPPLSGLKRVFQWLRKLKNQWIPSFSLHRFLQKTVGRILAPDLIYHRRLPSSSETVRYRFTRPFLKQLSSHQASNTSSQTNAMVNALNEYFLK